MLNYSYRWAIVHCIQNGYVDSAYLYTRMLARHALRARQSYETLMARREMEKIFMLTGKSRVDAMRMASLVLNETI